MDERLKTIYEEELEHLLSHADEFAARVDYGDLAERVGFVPGSPPQDPFVQWLLSGYAFLAARVRGRLDDEFPRFSQNILSVVHPHVTAPTPSMIVAQFSVKPDAGLLSGPTLARGEKLHFPVRSDGGVRGRQRDVVYTLGRDLRVWPIEVKAVEFLPDPSALKKAGASEGGASGISIDLDVTVNEPISSFGGDELDLFLTSSGRDGSDLFEALALSGARVEVTEASTGRAARREAVAIEAAPLGLDRFDRHGREDALLPYDDRSYDGYRLLHEFFALPARFHFLRLSGLRKAFSGRSQSSARILFVFDRPWDDRLVRVRKTDVRVNCAPAVNLFRHQADDARLSRRDVSVNISPDRGDPTRYEPHSVISVQGRGEDGGAQTYRPFFSFEGLGAAAGGGARFFATHRRARPYAASEVEGDPRLAEYRGADLSISLVDEAARPMPSDLKALSINLLCTNRHLPLYGRDSKQSLKAERDLGWTDIQIVAGPSVPRLGLPDGPRLWDAISHLSLNYLSLEGRDSEQAATALRQIVGLYAPDDQHSRDLTGAILGATAATAIARAPRDPNENGGPAPVAFLRGLEIGVVFRDGTPGAATLAAVMERFLTGYAAVNSFTKFTMKRENGEPRLSWPARSGARTLL